MHLRQNSLKAFNQRPFHRHFEGNGNAQPGRSRGKLMLTHCRRMHPLIALTSPLLFFPPLFLVLLLPRRIVLAVFSVQERDRAGAAFVVPNDAASGAFVARADGVATKGEARTNRQPFYAPKQGRPDTQRRNANRVWPFERSLSVSQGRACYTRLRGRPFVVRSGATGTRFSAERISSAVKPA